MSMHQMAPLWPLKVPSLSPLLEYQTVGLLSLATENKRSPSRLYLIERGKAEIVVALKSIASCLPALALPCARTKSTHKVEAYSIVGCTIQILTGQR